jgi:hypothetical protein
VTASGGGRRFGVTFDDADLAEDLEHASAAGRIVALDARRQFAIHGIPVALLRPCVAEARDGTRLPGCVKTYLPAPLGDWGMVFQGRLSDRGQPFMHCLAFGRRHPLRATQPSVYDVAARRL